MKPHGLNGMQSAILIDPVDGYARALFGVFQMAELLDVSEKTGAPFHSVRDHIYERRPEPERRGLEWLATALGRVREWPDFPKGFFVGVRAPAFA